jgi:hypothetical protein
MIDDMSGPDLCAWVHLCILRLDVNNRPAVGQPCTATMGSLLRRIAFKIPCSFTFQAVNTSAGKDELVQ